MFAVLFLERGTRQRLAFATTNASKHKHTRTQAVKTASAFFIALKLPSVASVENVERTPATPVSQGVKQKRFTGV